MNIVKYFILSLFSFIHLYLAFSWRYEYSYLHVHFTQIVICLFPAEDGQRSTPAGLWILFAFLFFVIFEKLFAIVNEEAPIILEQQQINRNSTESTKRRKEVENNNSITIINTVKRKNGILKKCLQNTTEVIERKVMLCFT